PGQRRGARSASLAPAAGGCRARERLARHGHGGARPRPAPLSTPRLDPLIIELELEDGMASTCRARLPRRAVGGVTQHGSRSYGHHGSDFLPRYDVEVVPYRVIPSRVRVR